MDALRDLCASCVLMQSQSWQDPPSEWACEEHGIDILSFEKYLKPKGSFSALFWRLLHHILVTMDASEHGLIRDVAHGAGSLQAVYY